MDLSRAADDGIAGLRARLVAEPPPGVAPAEVSGFFARHGAALSSELHELLEAALAAPVRTPGTRLQWSTLREWLKALSVLERRRDVRPSAAAHRARGAHWATLGRQHVATAEEAELSELKQRLPKLPSGLHEMDSQRALRVRLADWIEQRRQELRKRAALANKRT